MIARSWRCVHKASGEEARSICDRCAGKSAKARRLHALIELHRVVAHAARAAARAQPAALAREGHEHVVSTPFAVAAEKTTSEVATRELDHLLARST